MHFCPAAAQADIPPTYPNARPRIYFVTRILHPRVRAAAPPHTEPATSARVNSAVIAYYVNEFACHEFACLRACCACGACYACRRSGNTVTCVARIRRRRRTRSTSCSAASRRVRSSTSSHLLSPPLTSPLLMLGGKQGQRVEWAKNVQVSTRMSTRGRQCGCSPRTAGPGQGQRRLQPSDL